MKKWTRVTYQPNLPLTPKGYVTASREHITLSKEAAKEGMVLLKNENKLLPVKEGTRIALFGKGSFDYVKGGGGSGDVTVSYIRNLYQGLKMQPEVTLYEPLCDFYRRDVEKQYEEGAKPGMTVEPKLCEALVKDAAASSDMAVIVISRFSGEGWDRSSVEFKEDNPWGEEESMPQISARVFPEGDFYLTEAEKAMVSLVEKQFDKVAVVLNIGGMIDTSWIKNDDRISSALIMWQGGMEGGLAAAEILMGKGTPSGKLTDTYAACVTDYPSTANFHESPYYVEYTDDIYVGYRYFETIPGASRKVVYPFGFGLSYTTFELETRKAYHENGIIKIQVQVTNTGNYPGKEVVQAYYSAPQGILGKPAKELAAFQKTRELLPGESQLVLLEFPQEAMASYDDIGKTAKSAYVMEAGKYNIYMGNSIRNVVPVLTITLKEDKVTCQLTAKAAPTSLKKRMLSDGSYEALPMSRANDPDECVLVKMKSGSEEGIVPAVRSRERCFVMKLCREGAKTLLDVAEGRVTLDEFMAQLSDEELIVLLGGQPNKGVANTFGFGNLEEYGVPNIMTADGPAGLRIQPECGVCTTAWPCATSLASTWNPEIVEQVGKAGAREVKENNIAVWLTPAVNVHRNPLCGRNFEYYSEDPYVAGKIGAAMVRGIQSQHIAATVKHFACNNKETNRKNSDSRVSERALREIYLKAFEIIVKESDPWAIMSSYNMINGHRASENHDLLEGILRDEWGFGGAVTTDWWTRGEHYKEIKAGNDIKMATGYPERVKAAMAKGEVSREDLLRCARRVLSLILKID